MISIKAELVVLYENNISNPKQLQKLTSFLSSIETKYPLFIAVDQEGEEVQRLDEKKFFSP